MNVRVDTEIHFHEQEVVSVYSEDFSDSELSAKIGGIGTATLFALRNLYNLGGQESADRLALVLLDAPAIIGKLVGNDYPTGFRLIPYAGSKGRKRFLTSLRLNPETFNFTLSPKGFGLLAKGINFYVPVALLAYVQWLVENRKIDKDFLGYLGQSLKECGRLQSHGQITAANQMQLAAAVLAHSCSEYIAEGIDD